MSHESRRMVNENLITSSKIIFHQAYRRKYNVFCRNILH